MVATAVLHARPSPGHDFAVPSPAMQCLGTFACSAPALRACLASCWTINRTGRPVAHWDAEPPD